MWAPDGQSLYFTSDRAGSPQIYRKSLAPGSLPQRITFTDSYNAGPRVSPDGKLLAMVTRANGRYCIAVQDLGSGAFRVLTRGPLDSTPSFAPNSATIIYSERPNSNGGAILATVSVDGLTGMTLKSAHGAVQNPTWGPFPQQ